MPPQSRVMLVLLLLVFIGGFVLAGVFWSPWPLVLTVAALVGGGAWRGARCPKCQARLVSRNVPGEDTDFRIFYECPECLALYDPHLRFDPARD